MKKIVKKTDQSLEINEIIFEYQYAFRKRHSTTLALVDFTDIWTKESAVSVFFVDLRF